jgi:UDP-N-acetylmuramoyl-tripeptide--D-alanyl-D-alanine ligase
MLPLTLAEVTHITSGRLVDADPALSVDAVTTDSRAVEDGDLFIGLRGERFDGDAFAAGALAAGAAAALVRPDTAPALPTGAPHIIVHDGTAALTALAAEVRRRSGARVVAITGSAGKTTTKDILAALLRPLCRVVATQGNQNNEIGLPLTLLAVDEQTEVVVCELAMRGRGQIRHLARVAAPDVGIITNIAPVHLELVGTLEDVAAAKAELLEELGHNSAVVPAGEGLLTPHTTRHRGRVVTFGPGGDVRPIAAEPRDGGTHVLIDAFGRRASLWFDFCGEHYVTDALAAVGAFLELGHPLAEARHGAGRVTFSELRGEVTVLRGGGLLLNDAYNANPLAMRAALDHLVELAAGRPAVAILGDMYELGQQSTRYHAEVGAYAEELGVRVLAVGALARDYLVGAPDEAWYPSVEACLAEMPTALPSGAAVLVKASRGLRLERVAGWLTQTVGVDADDAGAAPLREDPRD